MSPALHGDVEIRLASPLDIGQVHSLIVELADYEQAKDQVTLTSNQLREDGFGPNPKFKCFVAVANDEVMGMALIYERYSTWKGATLYLEDLIVRASNRRQGIGLKLMKHLISYFNDQGYKRLEWQVLDWNTDAISFYKSLDAEFDGEWLNCRIRPNEGI